MRSIILIAVLGVTIQFSSSASIKPQDDWTEVIEAYKKVVHDMLAGVAEIRKSTDYVSMRAQIAAGLNEVEKEIERLDEGLLTDIDKIVAESNSENAEECKAEAVESAKALIAEITDIAQRAINDAMSKTDVALQPFVELDKRAEKLENTLPTLIDECVDAGIETAIGCIQGGVDEGVKEISDISTTLSQVSGPVTSEIGDIFIEAITVIGQDAGHAQEEIAKILAHLITCL